MPRQPRFYYPGAVLHLVQRGNNRARVFASAQDHRFYLDCLRDAACAHDVAIHGYVLMTNHVHLLASPGHAQGTGPDDADSGAAIRGEIQLPAPAHRYVMGGTVQSYAGGNGSLLFRLSPLHRAKSGSRWDCCDTWRIPVVEPSRQRVRRRRSRADAPLVVPGPRPESCRTMRRISRLVRGILGNGCRRGDPRRDAIRMGPWQYVLSPACRSPDWPTRSSSSNGPSSNPTRAEKSSLTLHLRPDPTFTPSRKVVSDPTF